MRLKKLKQTVNEIRYFKKIITKYGDSLLSGRYKLFPSMRAIVADNPASIASATPYFDKGKNKSKTTAIISKLNESGYYRNKKSGDSKKYEAVYSANNYDKVREIKLFSFERNEILTICTCAEDCQKQIAEYDTLHEYFGMPHLEKQTEYDNSYEISMVRLMPRPSEVMALENIADCVAKYSTNHTENGSKQVSDLIEFNYSNADITKLLGELASIVDESMLSFKIPTCLQHGDLSRDNLIYGKCDEVESFWWIDWEHARPRVFFYDYFFYILNTAVYYSDDSALRSYINGECDAHLKEFFTACGIKYEPCHRKDYFIIFAVDFLKQRVCDLGNVRALAMYCDFIKGIKF